MTSLVVVIFNYKAFCNANYLPLFLVFSCLLLIFVNFASVVCVLYWIQPAFELIQRLTRCKVTTFHLTIQNF